jgi:curved DNA-binding protein
LKPAPGGLRCDEGMADFYKDLGVSRDASADEIKKAYRKLAGKLHPDKNQGDAKTEAQFKAVNRAYQALSDPQKRKLYDEFGEDALREGFDAGAARSYREATRGGRVRSGGGPSLEDLFGNAGPGGFGDMLGDLLGNRSAGGGGRRRGGVAKGADLQSEVKVDFVSAIRGAELKLRVQGAGEEVTVRVPPGAGDGDRVRIPGHGQPGAFGGPPGDLVLTIRVEEHPHFERSGLDLYLDLPITIGEAYHGAKVRVPTLEGAVTLTIPPHAQSGQVARLKGKGVKRQQQQGDLYVRFDIKLPDAESKEIEKAVAVLESAVSGDVREGIGL